MSESTVYDALSSFGCHRSFVNDPADFLPEALGGALAAYPDARWYRSGFIGRRSALTTHDGKPAVAVVSGGGSGHEPMHVGFLGAGMLDAVCPGLLFTSPNAVQITEATRWADQGAGVLHIVKNYTGDVMNFSVARQALGEVDTAVVLVADDAATCSSPGDQAAHSEGPGARGTGATIIVEKIAGALAARGADLRQVAETSQWVADHSCSMAVALAPGYLPTSGRDTFDLPAGKMEIGVGIHGERGVDRVDVESADAIVTRLLDGIDATQPFSDTPRVILLVNGLGGTTALELSLLFGVVVRQLEERGVQVCRGLVGTFVSSVNMHGVSVSITKATDEVLELLDDPTDAPAWPRVVGGRGDTPVRYSPARIEFDDVFPDEGAENTWLSDFVARVQASTGALTELDRLAGDGDFGQNMDAAFGGIDLPVRGTDAEVLAALSRRLLIRAGGTSGAVLGTLFRELSTALAQADSPVEGMRCGMSAASQAIMELGGAQEGDSTLLDALIPAARAAQEYDGADFMVLLHRCYKAAAEGAERTRDVVATKGRASYVGAASQGVVDPGAILVSWLFGGSGEEGE